VKPAIMRRAGQQRQQQKTPTGDPHSAPEQQGEEPESEFESESPEKRSTHNQEQEQKQNHSQDQRPCHMGQLPRQGQGQFLMTEK